MHVIDGSVPVMIATVLVSFERIGLAAAVGGVGVWLLVRCT